MAIRRTLRGNATRPPRILSIDELETGLRLLGHGKFEHNEFWDENIGAFRQTVIVAIRDTSEALLSPGMNERWRVLLERQLESLVEYLELADRYMARRKAIAEARVFDFPSAAGRIH